MTRRPLLLAAPLALAALALAGCAGSADTAPTGDSGSAVSAERCSLNKDAGDITYLSGYQWQASASILEVVAAKELGYFDDLCLNVSLEPGSGETSQNTQLLAAGTVQFTPLSLQNLIQAQDAGVDVLGISSYSNEGLEVLLTMPDITKLTQLEGTILGHKGQLPPTVAAMLDEEGVDMSTIEQVQVGYDPSVLPRGQVTSLTGFISNEPNLLEAAGDEVTVWSPYDYGVPSSLGAMAVNPAFASEHPTAVEDFLRAILHAYAYCADNAEECVGYTAELSGDGYDAAHNQRIWETEAATVADTLPDGWSLGAIDTDNYAALGKMLVDYDLLENPATADDASSYIDTSFIEAIYDGDALVWPAP